MNLFRLCGDVLNQREKMRSPQRRRRGTVRRCRTSSQGNAKFRLIRKVAAAGGFPAYERSHRQALTTEFAAKAFPRLPTDVAGDVVAFAFHVGYY